MKRPLAVIGLMSAIAVVAFTGCRTATPDQREENRRELREATEAVRVTGNPLLVKDCKYLGTVDDHGWRESRDNLTLAAHALGANTLFVGADTSHGEAYRCEPPKP